LWKRKANIIHCGKRKLEGGNSGKEKRASFTVRRESLKEVIVGKKASKLNKKIPKLPHI
jgi:hypothetical protein